MLRNQFSVCLVACLVISMTACKKEQPFETSLSHSKKVLIDQNANPRHRCNTDLHMQHKYQQNQRYRRAIQEGRAMAMENFKKLNARSLNTLSLYTIPVHFIVVHRPSDPMGNGTNISHQRIMSQLEALNLDFLRRNSDAVNTPNVFPAQNSQIQFCMAAFDPSGNPTNGITRYATRDNFDDHEWQIKGATSWDPLRYLNIWIAPDIEGLGYAYLPSTISLPERNEDGVVILTSAFGGPNSGAETPFDLGRTLTHEVGHYLGLDHIWGEGCNIDDGISDTPEQQAENVGCPTHPSPSCSNSGDMFMNYMDYTDDHCLNAFTTGQVMYMRRILESSRSSLIQPGRTNCSQDPDEPTCSDGIKNGLETDVDCGGPDCPPCSNPAVADAGVLSVEAQNEGNGCASGLALVVTLKNYGNTQIKSMEVVIKTADQVVKEVQWNGNLTSGSTATLLAESLMLSTGSHTIQVATKNPNGNADSDPSNDAARTTIHHQGGMSLRLRIQPDDYGSEITWQIRSTAGEVFAKGGSYDDYDLDLIEEQICIPDGCYRLVVNDDYGDGICCDYGEGWYTLSHESGRVLVDSDGYYGYRETTRFCIENQSVGRQATQRSIRTKVPPKKKRTLPRPTREIN